jgi:serine/threonine protein kinase/tetratricopeptide (TPR) repeat protein
MGEVWRAHDLELQIDIAVKLLHPQLAAAEGAVAFMKNECRAARRLNHPNIVSVYDFHQQDDLAFISMEWVDGPTFDRWQASNSTHRRSSIRVLAAVADALDHIHRQGLVHRDVKARNILMAPGTQPKLTDFGIVGLWRFQPSMLDIQSGGSHASMSPQQREGRPPHPADDIYALGVLLYESLTGTPPPPIATADTLAPTMASLSAEGATSDELRILANDMLARTRDGRPASMTDVREALQAALTAPERFTAPPDAEASSAGASSPSLTAAHIDPQAYTPVDQETEGTTSRKGPLFWALLLVMGAAGLIAAGIGIIGYLAKNPLTGVAPRTASQTVAPAPTPPAPSTDLQEPAPKPQAASSDAALTAAEEQLAQWLQLHDQLKSAQASAWAPEKLTNIEAVAQEADAAMTQRAYPLARETYAAAIAEGKSLLAGRDALFASQMAQGQEALAADQPAEAQTHFEMALKIKPGDDAARQAMANAELRGQILPLVASAQAHEREGRYDLALADYESVLKRDQTYAPARRAVERLKAQFAEEQYNRLVAEGLNALYQQRLSEARAHIKDALQYRPGGHEAREALHQIDTAAREQQIARLQRRGRAAESQEIWTRALKAYEDVLAIDPALQFAREGAARTRERIRLDKRLRFYLDHPDRLASERYLEEARLLLIAVEALKPRGPRLAQEIHSLQTALQTAQVRIPVTLVSDGQTEVAVLRVARLGRITRETLELRPGIYTIVGARNGYKDVRQTIRIQADQTALQVAIACKEKI